MQSPIVLLMCLLPSILVHARGSNISTGYTTNTNKPVVNLISLQSNHDDRDSEEDQFITTKIRNIIIMEQDFQSELNYFFGNLSILLSENTTRYEEYITSLLPEYLNHTEHFLVIYSKLLADGTNNQTLKKAIVKLQIPESQEALWFGITILSNLKNYINYSDISFVTRKETVNQFIDIYKFWRLVGILDKHWHPLALNLSKELTPEDFKNIEDLIRKSIVAIFHIIDSINNFENTAAKERSYNQTIGFSIKDEMHIWMWKKKITLSAKALWSVKKFHEKKTLFQERKVPVASVKLAIDGVLITIGTLTNGVLIFVFILNKKMRSAPNFPLINLAIVDIYCLAVNTLLIIYSAVSTMRYEFCKIYDFCQNFGIALSIYSVTLSSFQRYLAVTKVSEMEIFNCSLLRKLAPYTPIGIVWVISASLACLKTWFVEYIVDSLGVCTKHLPAEYINGIVISEFVFVSIIPLFTIAVTSIITSYRIRKSIKNIPGETEGLKPVLKARALSFKVVLTLTVVFIISYFPYFLIKLYTKLWYAPHSFNDMHLLKLSYAFIISRSLMYLNSCCNPVALYLMSRTYRKYMNKYITCGYATRINKQNTP